MEEVAIAKLVHGGQGLGELADGRKVFVWNALPGETVRVRIIKKKRSYSEAIAEEVVTASPERAAPREENYLATSPWQMMTFEAENRHKAAIVRELFAHEKVVLPQPSASGDGNAADDVSTTADAVAETIVHDDREWQYRNKMEYSFWGDENGLHLALHRRGSHGKQIVQGSELAMPALDEGARSVLNELKKLDLRAGDLKTIIVRCSQKGEVVAALYTKLDEFPNIVLPDPVKGLRIYHSNPKSPASVPTRLLYQLGDPTLQDELLGRPFTYDVDSFFQVNLPVYERALTRIREHCAGDPVDMYAGTGSIGLTVAKRRVELIELDPATAAMARVNARMAAGPDAAASGGTDAGGTAADDQADGVSAEVVEASTEKALEHITGDRPVIFDPPRAGLHPKVVEKCLQALPPQIIYLSCNPATQARDLALLTGSAGAGATGGVTAADSTSPAAPAKYTIEFFEIYNFFPRTPHIETLAIVGRI